MFAATELADKHPQRLKTFEPLLLAKTSCRILIKAIRESGFDLIAGKLDNDCEFEWRSL